MTGICKVKKWEKIKLTLESSSKIERAKMLFELMEEERKLAVKEYKEYKDARSGQWK